MMNFKLLLFLLAFVSHIEDFSQCKICVDQDEFSQSQISKMLTDFYSKLAALCSDPNELNLEEIYLLKKEYCTSNYFKEIEELNDPDILDYEPLVNGQDFGNEYIKNLSIEKDKVKSNIYYVSFSKPNDKQKTIIKLRIAKINRLYKIDYVFLDSNN